MLIDVFAQPAGFSFADAISDDLGLGEPATPAPNAISYRIDGPVLCDEGMGTQITLWRRLLGVDQPLPELPLALDEDQRVVINLESTYYEAARRVYLD
jgi:hypothetical protein